MELHSRCLPRRVNTRTVTSVTLAENQQVFRWYWQLPSSIFALKTPTTEPQDRITSSDKVRSDTMGPDFRRLKNKYFAVRVACVCALLLTERETTIRLRTPTLLAGNKHLLVYLEIDEHGLSRAGSSLFFLVGNVCHFSVFTRSIDTQRGYVYCGVNFECSLNCTIFIRWCIRADLLCSSICGHFNQWLH